MKLSEYNLLVRCLLLWRSLAPVDTGNIFKHQLDRFERRYWTFSEKLRLEMLDKSKEMFYFAYDNYMTYAFPQDELNPIYCTGRGPDLDNVLNINVNDVLGDYCLTLVDTLDTLAVMGNATEFRRAVQLVKSNVSFNKNNTVQVFEANIRLLGALLSAHLLIMDESKPFGELKPSNYDNDLLDLAHDLASRLMPAFDNTKTGIPFPRVNLKRGVPEDCSTETCTAGAGSLILEFGVLSRLLNDPVYESVARRAIQNLWKLRSKKTGLLGNVIDMQTGSWIGRLSGLGAGLDSFYEYLLKSYILFGQSGDLQMFNESYSQIKQYLRRGRLNCNSGSGDHPLYVNVDMHSGVTTTPWIDSLQASFSGVQVLMGDIEEAICSHIVFYSIWRLYGALPERFNWQKISPEISFYPLRPELVEATYMLYQATKNPFYLHVGKEILESLNLHSRTKCGFATMHNVEDKTLEDRMESFFLSETCKYLFLLFDKDNHINRHASKYIFTTEGHVFPVNLNLPRDTRASVNSGQAGTGSIGSEHPDNINQVPPNSTFKSCTRINEDREYFLPLERRYFSQLNHALGLDDS